MPCLLTAQLLIIVFAIVSSWLLLAALLPQLRLRLLDQPNGRSSHLQATPRGGGVVFVLIFFIACALAWFGRSVSASVPLSLFVAPLISMPLALVGFLDDRYNLPVRWRYCVQLVTALFIILSSPLFSPSLAMLPLLVLLLIGITSIINIINFMDGLDGLVAGCMAVALTVASLQLDAPWPIWALVGALLGFLLWNWSPAKVFMGDVGSTFLGSIFATLVLQESTWSQALALLLIVTPLWGDASICVMRRLMSGQRVFQAHRLHLYQRLNRAGWPHARVSSLYISATAILAVALLWGGLPWVIAIAIIELVFGIWLDQKVALPFVDASRL